MTTETSFLLVIDSCPYGTWKGREILDMAFAIAAFDHKAALFFTGAGVNWLREHQAADLIGQKSVLRNLSAAGLFGIEAIYADSDSLRRFGLDTMPDSLEVTLTESRTVLQGIYDHVVQL